MKNIINKILLLVAIVASLSSCREMQQHGDFSGQWQVLTIEYPDGMVKDVQGEIYYNFQRNLCQLTMPQEPNAVSQKRVTGVLDYHESWFTVDFRLSNYTELEPFGIIAPEGADMNKLGVIVRYNIDSFSSERMVMTTDCGTILTCRKF